MRYSKGAYPLFLAVLLILSSVSPSVNVSAATGSAVYIYGNQVTIKVYPTGSFIVNPMDFPSRFSDSSSFWSFNVDGKITTTYNPLTLDHVVTPVKVTQDGAIKVQYILESEVLVDITYREAGPSAWITVTFINIGLNPHTVGLRYLYDMNGKTVMPYGESPPTTETSYNSPSFPQVDVLEGSQRQGLVALASSYGTTAPSKVTIGSWDTTWATNWEYAANSTVGVGNQPTLLVYWENMNLPVKGFVRVNHAFGGGAPSHTAKSLDLLVESVTADPMDQYISMKRTIKATIKNQGPAVSNIEIDFFITDNTGKFVANGTASKGMVAGGSVDVSWTYEVKKLVEVSAYVIVDPSDDVAPVDNQAKTSIIAHPFPFKVGLKFPDETRIAYISINSGEKATATVVVMNQGTVNDNISLGLSVVPEGWDSSFEHSTVNLGPGHTAEVKIVIKTVKDNSYYNYGIDVVGRSMGGGVTDKVLLFISFADIIAKSGGNISFHGNHSNPNPGTNPGNNNTNPTIPSPDKPISLTGPQVAVIFIMFGAAFIGAVAIYQIYLMRSKSGLKGILKDFYKKLYDANTSDAYRKAIYKA